VHPIDRVTPFAAANAVIWADAYWAAWPECRIVPSMLRWPIALRAAATARDAFIRESIE